MWVLLGLPVLALLLVFLLRPFYLHRGLTDEEWRGEWLGDGVLPNAGPSGSRGIVIEAPASKVWPWITQLGQDRGGFYSYRWLENLVGARMPDVREIRKEWSHRDVGDRISMAPVERFGEIATMEVAIAHQDQALVVRNHEGTWAFLLVPLSPVSCRLIARGTWILSRNPLGRLVRAMVFDPIHYVMEWKMLCGIKALAEKSVLPSNATKEALCP